MFSLVIANAGIPDIKVHGPLVTVMCFFFLNWGTVLLLLVHLDNIQMYWKLILGCILWYVLSDMSCAYIITGKLASKWNKV